MYIDTIMYVLYDTLIYFQANDSPFLNNTQFVSLITQLQWQVLTLIYHHQIG